MFKLLLVALVGSVVCTAERDERSDSDRVHVVWLLDRKPAATEAPASVQPPLAQVGVTKESLEIRR